MESGHKAEVFRPRNTKTFKVELTRSKGNPLQLPPVLIVALGFLLLIGLGTLLLCMPFATAAKTAAPFLTALFTATSSVCVTGLAVVETGTYWSVAGQVIIMILVQLGGFGFMCSSTLILLLLGQRIGIRERTLTRQSLDWTDSDDLIKVILMVVQYTIIIEAFGAFLYYESFIQYYDIKKAVWYSIFHAISAFNNAGMDIFGTGSSLATFIDKPSVLLTTTFLVIMGSISFAVVSDLLTRSKYKHIRLDTKIVLAFTAMLLVGSTIYFMLGEWNNPNTIGGLSTIDKIVNSVFLATVLRTAGFSSINLSMIDTGSILLLIVLMSCGAASGSTGGGIKVNNIGLLFFSAISTLRGDEHPKVFGRELAPDQINKAMTLTCLYFVSGMFFTIVLALIEDFSIIEILFECFSAMGTVGSSLGITPLLSSLGKTWIIFIMFIGRLGPMTLVSLMISKNKHTHYRYPIEYIRMG